MSLGAARLDVALDEESGYGGAPLKVGGEQRWMT
jgi:hypothetical protein